MKIKYSIKTTRMTLQCAEPGAEINKPELVHAFMKKMGINQFQEEVYVLLCDGKRQTIDRVLVAKGEGNCVSASPRAVFGDAMRLGAMSIILVHNHPSGHPDPSEDDLAFTRRMKSAGELLGVPLVDHVIVCPQAYYSFRAEGLLQ